MPTRSRPNLGLLGRDRELATIENAVAVARAGRGATICLLGETGTGRTSLLAAAADLARDAGLDVAGTAGSTWFGRMPLAAAFDLVDLPHDGDRRDRPLPGASPEHAPDDDREAPGEGAVRRLLARAARRPTAFLVDDAELLDPASLEVIAALARRMLTTPAVLVIAARHRHGDQAEPLGELIASVPPERTIELSPLSPGNAARLVTTLLGLELGGEATEACGRLTGGIPLQVRLLADQLALTHRTADRVTKAELEAAASVSIRRFLQRGTIERDAVRLLAALALTGGSTSPDVAARVGRVDPEAASRCAQVLAAYGLEPLSK